MRPIDTAAAIDLDRDRAFFDASPHGMAVLDRSGRTLRVNRALRTLLGATEAELLDQRLLDTVEPGIACEKSFVRSDGSTVHAQYTVTRVADEYVAQFVDDTARRATLDSLQQRLGEQAVITLLGDRALSGAPLDELIAEAVSSIVHVLETEMGGYAELAADGHTLTMRSAIGWPDGFEGRTFELPADLGQGGAAGEIAVLVGDPRSPIGMLTARGGDSRTFGDADVNFLRAVAHVLAGAIERSRADERARYEELHDSLTGLPNRELLFDRIEQALSRDVAAGGQLFVLLLDVDSLGLVNDGLGHAIGDEVLREVASRLDEAIGPADTVALITGDEFGILCVDPESERQADRIAEQVRAAFVKPFVLAGEPHFISASFGVTSATGDSAHTAGDLLRDADTALKRAKQRGRGGYELFDPCTRARVVSRLKVESELRNAIEGDQLRVEYQPYYRLPDMSPAGIEALVRWQHPERGLVPPGDFIPVAEQSGLIVPIGEWVLRRACADLAGWRAEHDWATGLRVTVNVSARQVHEPGLPATVANALSDAGLPAGLLGIEITEGLLLDQERAPVGALSALKQLGVRLLLDDFGTGYSSLSYLSRFPVDVLKVDRSFVRDLGSRTESGPIVQAVVSLAQGLRLDVIAEGIETESQAERLREIGCDYGQGFLMSRPLPPSDLADLLSAH